jgi:hypothetical protein
LFQKPAGGDRIERHQRFAAGKAWFARALARRIVAYQSLYARPPDAMGWYLPVALGGSRAVATAMTNAQVSWRTWRIGTGVSRSCYEPALSSTRTNLSIEPTMTTRKSKVQEEPRSPWPLLPLTYDAFLKQGQLTDSLAPLTTGTGHLTQGTVMDLIWF